ncbi:MAG: ABC transporter ATP-binding protein [Ignavibacteriae bacterium]|nr:ABC transporter ATP-binding protein [Ignavibacteriota bacterium]MCB9214780.1 ABC transporter ATP-binding protein [Ignavibacteria bacterium]
MTITLRQYGDTLLTYLRPQRKRALLLCAVILASIAMQVVNPQFVRNFIDGAMAGEPTKTLIGFGIAFLAVSLVNQALTAIAAWQGAHVGWTATNILRSDLARHLLRLEMSFHNNRTPGELIERVDGDITALANFFSQFVVRIAGAAFLILGIIITVTIEDWRMGLAVFLYAAVTIFVLVRMKNVAMSATEREREASAVAYGFVEERLAGIEDIRANGGGPFALRRFQIILRQMLIKSRRAWMRRSTFWFVLITLFTLGDVIALGLGSELYFSGLISIGTIMLFYLYSSMLWEMVDQIIQQMADLQKAGAAIERVGNLMAIEPKMVDGNRSVMPTGPLSVEFDGVTFAYNDRDKILDNVSFKLEKGKVLGLLGRTGSGKTTLTRLLFRLYDPTDGRLLIGGVDPRDTERDLLRKHVAMVTQEVQLFHSTVRDNLTFFNSEIPDSRIFEVIEQLGLRDWFDALPQGLDTELTAGGGGLSAGEAQLLAFTRVFLHDPGLVVLDEPSSRLDPATERLLEGAMNRLLKNRTGIIIAHRLATVARADEIMILDKGRILEYGSREELVADTESRFYELLTKGLEELEEA